MKVKCFLIVLFAMAINVSAQEITTFTGIWGMEYYQDDKEITKKEVKELFSSNNEIYSDWKKADTKKSIATIALVGEIVGVTWGSVELFNNDPFVSDRDKARKAIGPLLGGIGSGIIAIIFLNGSYKARKQAILAYNKQFDDKTAFKLIPVANENGLGIALRW